MRSARARRFGTVVLLALAPACHIVDANTHNLRELHDEDGRHQRTAALMGDTPLLGDTTFAIHQLFAGLLKGTKAELTLTKPTKVEDPLEECVDNLIELADFSAADPAVGALQVECFARYAAIDPWQISRRICARELGKAGARLELAKHPPEPSDGPVATPEMLRGVLSPLIQAVAGQPVEGKPPPDLASACRAMAELDYDLDGLLRALSASAALLRRERVGSSRRDLLLELVEGLERRTVTAALERAAVDPNPSVRAAALEAQVEAGGAAFLARALPRLGTEREPAIQLSLLSLVRSRGLPGAAASGPAAAQSEKEGELALVYRAATENPDERVRVCAMQALGAVAGSGFESLREEDWQAWWAARTAPAAP